MCALWDEFKTQLKNPDTETETEADEWHWVKDGKKKEHIIDMSVYSRYRPMRLPLCCKSGGAPFVRISGDPFDENDDFTAKFAEDDPGAWKCFAISNPVTDDNTTKVSIHSSSSNQAIVGRGRKRKISSIAGAVERRVRSAVDRSQCGQELHPDCMEVFQTMLDAAGSEGCNVTGQMIVRDNDRVISCKNDGVRKCLHGRDTTHTSNNAYLLVDRQGDVTYKCHAAECKQKMYFLGSLPEHCRHLIAPVRQLTDEPVHVANMSVGISHEDGSEDGSEDDSDDDSDNDPAHPVVFRHNISEDEVLELLGLTSGIAEIDNGDGMLYDIAAILKRFGYKSAWDTWAPTILGSRKRAKTMWKAIKASRCQHDLNYIIRAVNEDRKKDKLSPVPKIEIIHFERPCLSEANQRRVTAEIDVQYLESEMFMRSTVAVESCTGTGKTSAFVEYAKRINKPIISVCARRSQVETHVNYFNKCGISTVQYDDSDSFHNLNVGVDSIVITIDSLPKLRGKFPHEGSEPLCNYILLFDEFHSLNSHIFFSTTLRHKRRSVMKTMRWLLKHAGKVVVMDNEITDLDLAVLDSALGKDSETCVDLVFIKNTRKKYCGIQVFYEECDEMLEKMLEDMENDRGFTVPCNTKKQTDRIMIKLLEKAKTIGLDPDRFKLYTSEQGKVPENVNREWSGNFVFYSPTITTGIDFQPDEAQNVYVFIDGEGTTSPASILQMITRNRRINEVHVSAINMKNMTEFTSYEQMCQRLDTLLASKAKLTPEALSRVDALQELQDCTFNEATDEDDYSDNEFSKLYKQAIWHDNKMRSSFLYQLDGLLESRGFRVNRRPISQMANRGVGKACELISNDQADLLDAQRTRDRVDAYFKGHLRDSREDLQLKEYLDLKVGTLRGMRVIDIQKRVEWAEIEYQRKEIATYMNDNPMDRRAYLDVFSEHRGVSFLLNIKYAAFTDQKLLEQQTREMTKDFAECSLHSILSKARLYRSLLDIFNRDLPPQCAPLKPYDLTLKQTSYDEMDEIEVPDVIWQHYTHGRRIRKRCKDRPTNRRDVMQCITTLARELFGGRFVEKTETRKKGGKKGYNYKTNETAIKIATKIMKWTYTRDEIDPEFARRYEPRLQPSGTTAAK